MKIRKKRRQKHQDCIAKVRQSHSCSAPESQWRDSASWVQLQKCRWEQSVVAAHRAVEWQRDRVLQRRSPLDRLQGPCDIRAPHSVQSGCYHLFEYATKSIFVKYASSELEILCIVRSIRSVL